MTAVEKSLFAGPSGCRTHPSNSAGGSQPVTLSDPSPVEVDTCEHEGEHLERQTVWASTWYGTLVNLTLWDDHTLWIGVTLRAAENSSEYEVGLYPRCDGLSSDRIAEAFQDTVAVSTRLCYSESPEPMLRRIWNQTGEVQTKGALSRPRKAQPKHFTELLRQIKPGAPVKWEFATRTAMC